jgi:hypothetical protein
MIMSFEIEFGNDFGTWKRFWNLETIVEFGNDCGTLEIKTKCREAVTFGMDLVYCNHPMP